MKKIINVIACIFITNIMFGQTQFEWIKGIHNITNQWGGQKLGINVKADGLGNVYTYASFAGSIDVDPGVNVVNLTSIGGGWNMFISKFDAAGNFIWVKQFEALCESNSGMIIDHNNDVIVTGGFIGSVDFGSSILLNSSTNGIATTLATFVLKLKSTNGNTLWAKSAVSTNGTNKGLSIALGNNDEVLVLGSHEGQTNFNPPSTTSILSSTNAMYIMKLSSAGLFSFVRSVDQVSGVQISSDGFGNFLIGGNFTGSTDFDPNTGVFTMNSTLGKSFILKLNSIGNFIWAKQFGTSNYNIMTSMVADKLGFVYLTGFFTGTLVFPPAPTITSNGFNTFICKINSNGTFLWSRSITGTQIISYSLALDDVSNVYTTGYSYAACDLDPGIGTSNTLSEGAFISKLSTNGDFVWGNNYEGDGPFGRSITVDNSNNVYFAGTLSTTCDFDLTPATEILTPTFANSLGAGDIFVHKLSQTNSVALILILEGFFNVITGNMRPNLLNCSIPSASGTDCDDITVELHNPTLPYALVATTQTRLDIYGHCIANFPGYLNGTFYLVVKHRNSIETWSASPITISSLNQVNYDFTTSISQAFTDGLGTPQMADLSGGLGNGPWAFYSGDIDQNELVDNDDYILWDAAASNFLFGYEPEDLNGDGAVDNGDYPFWDANSSSFIYSQHP